MTNKPTHPSRKKTSPGFTLIELIITTSIAGFLFIMLGSTFLNLYRLRNRIHSSIDIQNYVDQTLYTLTEEAKWSDEFNIDASTDSLILTYSSDQEITYTYDTTNLQINKTILDLNTGTNFTEGIIPNTFQVTDFEIVQRSPNPDLPGFEVLMTLSTLPNAATQPETYTGKTAITVRNRYQFVPTPTPTP